MFDPNTPMPASNPERSEDAHCWSGCRAADAQEEEQASKGDWFQLWGEWLNFVITYKKHVITNAKFNANLPDFVGFGPIAT